jgi:hypothetical protein
LVFCAPRTECDEEPDDSEKWFHFFPFVWCLKRTPFINFFLDKGKLPYHNHTTLSMFCTR